MVRYAEYKPSGVAARFVACYWMLEDDSVARVDPRSDALVSHAVDRMIATGGTVDIATVAGQGGVSCRQFERRFLDMVGVPPKFFCRIQRFQRVFPVLEREDANWIDVA